MIWICPACQNELGELNAYCEYCRYAGKGYVYNPDKYYIRKIRINHIRDGAKPLTPQEELFAQLFNHEKILVRDMDTLTLRAHREELSKIAFEARARLTAVDDEDNSRKKKAQGDKPTGFARSVNTDETTTNAINTVKERQKRLSGKEKMLQGLITLYVQGGMSRSDAEKAASTAMGAGTILERLKDKEGTKEALTSQNLHSPLSQENGFVMIKREGPKESKPLFNPFAKKEE
jgi:hypothetical protein